MLSYASCNYIHIQSNEHVTDTNLKNYVTLDLLLLSLLPNVIIAHLQILSRFTCLGRLMCSQFNLLNSNANETFMSKSVR